MAPKNRTYIASTCLSIIITLLVTCLSPNRCLAFQQIDTIYVVQASHADVGFNAPPSVMQQRNHDRTVKALDLADTYPDFHWTIETAYQLQGFMNRATPANITRLKTLLQEGRFQFGANYTNLHSGLCSEGQLNRLIYKANEYAEIFNTPPGAAMLDDVPGFTWAIPEVLHANGIPFAVLGPNNSFGGQPNIPLQDRPFWWEGANGNKVLTWMTYTSYIEGYFEWGLSNLNNAKQKIPERIAEYEAAGYPYDALMVLRVADDEFPSNSMINLVRDWNNAMLSPKIVLATPDQFFNYILTKYGDVFPTYKGDAAGQWESAATVTPATTAIVRKARSRLSDLESLWYEIVQHTSNVPYPTQQFNKAWDLSLVFDEHSGGGTGWPGLLTEQEVKQENREFVEIALRCDDIVNQLEASAMNLATPALIPEGENGVVFYNPTSSNFDGIIEINTTQPLPADLRLIDPDGGPDAVFRWLSADYKSLAVKIEIPAANWHWYKISKGGNTPPPPSWIKSNQISIANYQLTLDNNTGTATHLLNTITQSEWIDQTYSHLFAGIEMGKNLDVFFGISKRFNPQPVTIFAEDDTATTSLFRRMLVLDKNHKPLREYRLYSGEQPRLDVRLTMRQSDLPFVPYEDHSNHYGIAFAANLQTPTSLFIDGPAGWYQPGSDSLPEAGMSHFGCSTGARLEGADGKWMSITSLDSPLFDVGEMQGSARFDLETDEVTLTWKLERHADVGEVKGGQHVIIDAEPGLPDAQDYWFKIRFGDYTNPNSPPPPDRDTLHQDMSPPFVGWVYNN